MLNKKVGRTAVGLAAFATVVAAPVLTAETYQYDSAGRLLEVRYDADLAIRYSYDANGNILDRDVVEERIFSSGFEASP